MNYVVGALVAGIAGGGYFIANRESYYFYPVEHDEHRNDPNDHWIRDYHGLYYPVKGSEKLVIMCHGNAGNVFGPSRRRSAEHFNEMGYSCYLMEYPGFGKMHGQGPPSEAKIREAARFLLPYWAKRYREIILYGESIGCPIATGIATDFKVHKLILRSGPSSMCDMINHIIVPGLGTCIADELDTLENLRRMKGQPEVLLMHSKDDELVPYECALKAREVLEELPNKYFFKDIKGGHNSNVVPWKYVKLFVDRQVWPEHAA